MNKYKVENNEKKIVVSELFIDIYKNFNVTSQVEKMKQLSKKELYLLLTCAFDKHSDDDPVVRHNLLDFREEAMKIYAIQNDEETTDQDLLDLIKETGDKYIDTDNIIDSSGNKLSDPLTKQEVRDAKINIIDKNN
jgi:hypothetical protein